MFPFEFKDRKLVVSCDITFNWHLLILLPRSVTLECHFILLWQTIDSPQMSQSMLYTSFQIYIAIHWKLHQTHKATLFLPMLFNTLCCFLRLEEGVRHVKKTNNELSVSLQHCFLNSISETLLLCSLRAVVLWYYVFFSYQRFWEFLKFCFLPFLSTSLPLFVYQSLMCLRRKSIR